MRRPLTMTPTVRRILSRENSKLGQEIYSFSLPAGGRAGSCPGESSICAAECYAKRGSFRYNSIQEKYSNLFRWSQDDPRGLALALTEEIHDNAVQTVRIHVSGDFYSADYIAMWETVFESCPSTGFYAYTRSWRLDHLRSALESAVLWAPNFRLWFSADRETGLPSPRRAPINVAWMMTTEDDLPPEPLQRDDVVFRTVRVRKQSVQKRICHGLVCPKENGIKHPSMDNLTCSTCRFCLPLE